MPAHNEALLLDASVTEVVEGLRKRRHPFEVLLVENGSTDRTAALAGLRLLRVALWRESPP
jgi:glycosyltransferase involved in cell wall biosynthesis